MSLDLLDTSEVRSATHAGVAAWQYQVGWWLSPFQIQAHPLWSGKPLKMRMPWDKPPTLAMIAPTYYKHDNYQFVGFPMPQVTLHSSQCRFDLNPSNTDAKGTFRSEMVELSEPGIDWSIENHRGGWPGFSGFRIAYLPEVRSPVFRLPAKAKWESEIALEWIGQTPNQVTEEICRMEDDGSWSQWFPLADSSSVATEKIQIRCWAIPDESLKGKVIRSVTVTFRKVG